MDPLHIPTKIKLFIVFIAVGIILGLIYILLTTPLYKAYTLHETPDHQGTFSSIQDDHIYSYSGLSFYKRPIDRSNEVTVLSNGFYLPTINSLSWGGDKGALITFDEEGYQGSLLQKEMVAKNIELNDRTIGYVWYFDFADKRLLLVNTEGIDTSSTYYSPSKNGFYYAKNGAPIPESDSLENSSLTFYSTETFKEEQVSKINPDLGEVTYIGECYDVSSICLTTHDTDKAVLHRVNENRLVSISDTGFDTINPTASPTVYIGTKYHDIQSGEASEDELLMADVFYIDIEKNSRKKLSSTVSASDSLLANINTSDHSFYILESSPASDNDKIPYIVGGDTLLGLPKTKKASFSNSSSHESTSKAVLGPLSRNSEGVTMFYDVDDKAYLITPKHLTYNSMNISAEEVEAAQDRCFQEYTTHHTYTDELKQFKIGITYDENYTKNIESFSNCVSKNNPESQIGYSFVFIGLSPSGRFVTN